MTMIFVPSNRFLEAELPAANVGLEGWITLRARRKSGLISREHSFKVPHRQRGPFHNLITDLGLDRFAQVNGNLLASHFHVGTGTTPPTVTDTQLTNFSASIGSPTWQTGNQTSAPYFAWRRYIWVSGIGELGNIIITEVGVSGQAVNGLLWSHELVRDSGGNPSTFPLQDDEQLEAIYELRLYAPENDVLATVSISGNNYDTVTRALNVTASAAWGVSSAGVNNTAQNAGTMYSGDLVAVTAANPSGQIGGAPSSMVDAAYGAGNYYRDGSATWGTGTAGSVRTVRRGFVCAAFQVRFDPVIPKTVNNSLTLHQRISWARV